MNRRNLGRPLSDEINRERLIHLLAERWVRRLVVVRAPGGFGKSIAVAQAIRDNDQDPTGIDVYVRCRSTMTTVADVADAVLDELGAPPASNDDHAAAISAAVESMSPADVCVCLDDVHLVASLDGMLDLFHSLLDDLPFHGHLMLSGRSSPPIRTARLRASDQLIEVTASDLAFDESELGMIASIHGVARDQLKATDGWPALTRLSVTAEQTAPADFLIEEIIAGMSVARRRALAVAVLAAVATPELLDACGVEVVTEELLRSVPLLTDFGGGSFGAHDLWHEMVDHLAAPVEQQAIAAELLAHLAETGRNREGVDIALRHELWPQALDEMMAVFVQLDVGVDLATVDRWLDALPGDLDEEPAAQFLRGTRDRMAGDIAGSTDLIRRAAAGFEARNDLDAETTAVLEMGLRSWLLDDSALWAEMWERSVRIVGDGGQRMAATSAMGRIVTSERAGDFAGALREYEAMGVTTEIELGHAATLAMLVGEPEKAIAYLDRQMAEFPKPAVEGLLNSTHWQAGNPAPVIELGGYVSHRLDNSRDVLLAVFVEAMVRANFGVEIDVARVEAASWNRSREQTFVALAHAAGGIVTGDEEVAAAEFEQRLASIGFDEPLLRGELRRYLPYSYVLSSTARTWLESGEGFGPLHHDLRGLARAFVAARDDPSTPIGPLPTNEAIFTWLPLPWSVELAVRLVVVGDDRGLELVGSLSDLAGAGVHRDLRRIALRWPVLRDAVESILGAVPAPPVETTHVRLIDSSSVSIGSQRAVPIARQRVNQLLCLLTLSDGCTRQTIESALWPDLEPGRARSNLRSTLRHVRLTLEPSRSPGEATFHLRQRGDRIWLQRSDLLRTDVWDVRQHLAMADGLDERGEHTLAIEQRIAAVESWGTAALASVRELDAALASVVDLEVQVSAAGCAAAERLLSQGRFARCCELAARVLSWDPFAERAHDVIIGAHLASGDLVKAERAIEACLGALDELGATPASGTEMLVRRFERRAGRAASGRLA